jgi:hypothetical protein
MTPAEEIAATLIQLGGPKRPKVAGSKPNSWHIQDFAMTPDEVAVMEQAIEEQFEQVRVDDEPDTW